MIDPGHRGDRRREGVQPLTAIAAALLIASGARVAHAAPAATPPAGPAATARASDAPITAAVLRRACLRLEASPGDGPAVHRLCRLEFDKDPGALLDDAAREQFARIGTIAQAYAEADWRAARGTVLGWERDVLRPAVGPLFHGLAPQSISESSLIWGVAQFIADRAKEQANLYLVQRFVGRTCEDHDGKRVMPNLCAQLGTIDASIDAFRAPSLLRAAARADATVAPLAVTRLVLESNLDAVRRRPDPPIAGEMLLTALLAAVRGAPFDEAVAAMASPELVGPRVGLSVEQAPASTSLYLAGVIGTAMGQPATSLKDDFGEVRLAVMYVLKALAVDLFLGRPWPSPTSANAPIWRCGDGAQAFCAFGVGAQLTTQLLTSVEALAPLALKVKQASTPQLKATALAELAAETTTLLNALAGSALPPGFASTSAQIGAVSKAFAAEQHAAVATLLLQLPDSMGIPLKLPRSALRGLSLVASVADADSASEVARVLATFVGGSRTFADKRNAANGFRVGLNAYAGASGGWERLLASDDVAHRGATYVAAFVPIGVELAWPVVPRYTSVRSVSLFFHAVDLGALTAWRLKSTQDVGQEPEVHLRQVFAPGGSVVFGFKGLPLSLGAGIAWSPQIRRVSSGGVTKARSAMRFPVFLALDIPLFP